MESSKSAQTQPPPPPPFSKLNKELVFSAPPPPPPPPAKKASADQSSLVSSVQGPPPPPPKTGLASYAALQKDFPTASRKPTLTKGNYQNSSWRAIDSVEPSSSGSAGVFFVNVKDVGTVVIKGCSNMPQEVYANFVALKLGLNVPNLRVIDYSAEGGEWDGLCAYMKRAATTQYGEGSTTVAKISKELDRAFVICMELAMGKDLESISPAELDQQFRISNRLPASVIKSRKLLREIGHIIAFDIVMNNWDRLPAGVWNNEGNIRNLIVESTPSGHRIVGIDNTCSCIDPEKFGPQVDKYISSVALFVQSIVQNPLTESIGLKKVRECIQEATLYDITTAGSVEVQLGILEGLLKCLVVLTSQELENIKKEVASLICSDWMEIWGSGMSKILPEFFMAVLDAVRGSEGQMKRIVDDMPLNHDLPASPPDAARVLVMQSTYHKSLSNAVDEFEMAFKAIPENNRPHFVLYPEGWIVTNSATYPDQRNNYVAKFCELAKQYQVYIIPGTLMEKTGGPKVHNTAPIIGKDGSILGLYRKRRPISTEKTEPGTTNFLFETEFGTVAVMICFDVENDDILKEVLAQKPFMILNPVHIPAPTRSGSDSIELQRTRSWKIALDSMVRYAKEHRLFEELNRKYSQRRKFEILALEHNVTIIRCDIEGSSDLAVGSSQVIGPYSTTFGVRLGVCHFMAFVDSNPQNHFHANPPKIHRTMLEDCTENRYCIKRMESGSDGLKIVSTATSGRGGWLFGLSDGSIRAWDGLQVSLTNLPILARHESNIVGIRPANKEDKPAFFAAFADGSIIQFDKAKVSKRYHVGSGITCVAWSEILVAISKHNKIHLARRSDGFVTCSTSVSEPVTCLCFVNEKLLVGTAKSVHLLDVSTGAVLSSTKVESGCTSVAFEPSTVIAAVGQASGVLTLFRVTENELENKFECSSHSDAISAIQFINTKFFLTSSLDSGLRLFKLSPKVTVATLKHIFRASTSPITSMHCDGFNITALNTESVALRWEFSQNNHASPITQLYETHPTTPGAT